MVTRRYKWRDKYGRGARRNTEKRPGSSRELTAMSMARFWRDQGKRDEARDLLAPVYGWFTEGFDTLNLKGGKGAARTRPRARALHRRRSISEICLEPMAVMSKRKRLSELRRGLIRNLPRPGTISATYWTIRAVPMRPSNACARRCGSRLTMPMQCSTSPYFCNEKTNTRKR